MTLVISKSDCDIRPVSSTFVLIHGDTKHHFTSLVLYQALRLLLGSVEGATHMEVHNLQENFEYARTKPHYNIDRKESLISNKTG